MCWKEIYLILHSSWMYSSKMKKGDEYLQHWLNDKEFSMGRYLNCWHSTVNSSSFKLHEWIDKDFNLFKYLNWANRFIKGFFIFLTVNRNKDKDWRLIKVAKAFVNISYSDASICTKDKERSERFLNFIKTKNWKWYIFW